MATAHPPTRIGARANASARSQRVNGPKDLGPRGTSGKPDTKARSHPIKPSSPNTNATGRGNLQSPASGKGQMAAQKRKTVRKMRATNKAVKPSGVTKAVRNVARVAKGVKAVARGSVAGAAVSVAASRVKAEKAARRKAFSKATGKKLDV